MGWIAAATVAWFGVDVVSALDAMCVTIAATTARVIARSQR
jgi:hypothetical protein